ncbi:hypothetical protein O1611_g2728 [Lasiodiplodia mahajangana]|uniref:Uncharacterized protein n=1 Tax=Lasiodiplodia mahajangana TaxID=1108764 RepID=A0ACC2JU98_9PEZI|nr:hypothetical protein O1611_g2728 [Lasiodiplodia mahajangana]
MSEIRRYHAPASKEGEAPFMAPEEETFRAYTQAQGQMYATGRPGYSPELFKIIIAHHTSTGGQLDTVVDIGCGTGQATLDLAPYFANAIGLDHRRPGGTAALWARTGMDVDPVRTPNGVAIKAVVDEIIATELEPFFKPGSTLTADLYVDLPLPWTLEAPVEEFDKRSFFRKVWNKHRDGAENDYLGTGNTITTEEFENLVGTISTVTRWREAYPDKAGTEEDVARKMRRRIESLLHEVGVKPGEEIEKQPSNRID